MKTITLITSLFLLLLSCTSRTEISEPTVPSEEREAKLIPQKTCPYQGTPIDPYKYVEYKNQYIYVCCQPCLKLVEKDPEKAIRILKNKYGEKLQEADN